jgi:hypothetical protein
VVVEVAEDAEFCAARPGVGAELSVGVGPDGQACRDWLPQVLVVGQAIQTCEYLGLYLIEGLEDVASYLAGSGH